MAAVTSDAAILEKGLGGLRRCVGKTPDAGAYVFTTLCLPQPPPAADVSAASSSHTLLARRARFPGSANPVASGPAVLHSQSSCVARHSTSTRGRKYKQKWSPVTRKCSRRFSPFSPTSLLQASTFAHSFP